MGCCRLPLRDPPARLSPCDLVGDAPWRAKGAEYACAARCDDEWCVPPAPAYCAAEAPIPFAFTAYTPVGSVLPRLALDRTAAAPLPAAAAEGGTEEVGRAAGRERRPDEATWLREGGRWDAGGAGCDGGWG